MALLETDPIDLQLDDGNDLVVTDDLQFTRGIPAIVQGARIALQMFQGEWFLNLDAGIPYWDRILGEKPSVAMAAAQVAFDGELRAIPGVSEVTKLNLTYAGTTRTLTIVWQVKSQFGDTPVDTIALEIGA